MFLYHLIPLLSILVRNSYNDMIIYLIMAKDFICSFVRFQQLLSSLPTSKEFRLFRRKKKESLVKRLLVLDPNRCREMWKCQINAWRLQVQKRHNCMERIFQKARRQSWMSRCQCIRQQKVNLSQDFSPREVPYHKLANYRVMISLRSQVISSTVDV